MAVASDVGHANRRVRCTTHLRPAAHQIVQATKIQIRERCHVHRGEWLLLPPRLPARPSEASGTGPLSAVLVIHNVANQLQECERSCALGSKYRPVFSATLL